MTAKITFVSHTNKPGGGELALRRYLEATDLPARLVTMEDGGVWDGLPGEIVHASSLLGLRRSLHGGGLVVANSMRAAFLTAIVAPRRTELVYWVRDGLTDSAMSRLALELTKHVTARRMNRYLANSEWTAVTVREELHARPESVLVVYSMCGVTMARLARPPRTPPPTSHPLRLLFLGRLSPWKAPDIAVRALTPLRELGIEATLTIAGEALFGEDAYAKELATLVSTEPRASLIGHAEAVPNLLDAHDVLVHCSTTPEPFGQVIVQGLAAGMPVVAAGAGGPVEILAEAPVDLLYTPGDPEELASRVANAVRHYAEVSSWSLVRARAFSDEKLAARLDTTLARADWAYIDTEE